MRFKKTGFTLIELMVVVLIIMLLAGVIVVNVDTARQKARDQKRIADMETVALALQAFYADNHYYPTPGGYASQCGGMGGGACLYPDSKNFWTQMIGILKTAGYLQSCPQDSTISMSDFCDYTTIPSQYTTRDSPSPQGYRYACAVEATSPYNCIHYLIGTILETSSGETSDVQVDCPSPCPYSGIGGKVPCYPRGPEYRLYDGEPKSFSCFW